MNVSHIVLLLCCSSVMSMLAGCEVKKKPHIVFETKTHEFTEPIIFGSKMVHTFTFTNQGNVPLQIERMSTDCWCVATNTSDEQIQSGESGSIRVEVERDIEDVGPFSEEIRVTTNDPDNTLVFLHVKGVVLPAVSYQHKIDLDQLEKGEVISKLITFKNNLKHDIEIINPTVSNEDISINLSEKNIPSGKSVEIAAVLSMNKVGFFKESLTLIGQTEETIPGTESNKLEMSIQFKGRVSGGIFVLPKNIFLGVLDNSGKSVQRSVQIKTDGSVAFGLKKVSADNFSVSASLSQEPQTSHEVMISITPKTGNRSSGLVEGTIQISTTHPDMSKITIPVKAVLQ